MSPLVLSAIRPQLTIALERKFPPIGREEKNAWGETLGACAHLLSFVPKCLKQSWLALLHSVKMSSGLDFDPYELDSWIGKIVSVCGSSGKRHVGRLIAIDPVSSR